MHWEAFTERTETFLARDDDETVVLRAISKESDSEIMLHGMAVLLDKPTAEAFGAWLMGKKFGRLDTKSDTV